MVDAESVDQAAEEAAPAGRATGSAAPASPATGSRAGLVRAGLVLTSLYLVSRLLGWVRVSILAATFGTGRDLDVYYTAFRIPDFMFQLVAAGALASALIPMIASLVATGERDRAWRVTSTVTNLMVLALLALLVGFEVAAPAIVPFLAPGFPAEDLARTVDLTRIMLISPILLALGTVATSALNANDRFGAAAVAPIAYNLGIIGGAILLSAPLGVLGLAIGVVAGSIGHLAVQLGPLRRTGFRYSPEIDLTDPRARQTFLLLAPRAFGLGVTQVIFIVVTSIASTLGSGAITILNFAWTLVLIPIGVVGVPLGAVVFPSLARDHATGSTEAYVSLVTRATRLIVFVMVPLTGLAIVLRREIVTLLFDYGRYDPGVTDTIATTLAFFMLGLVAFSGIQVLARAFYAREDTRTPVAAATLTVVVNSSLAVILAGPFQLAGIATSFSVANWIEVLILLVVLRIRLPAVNLAGLARLLAEAAAVTLVASTVALLVVDAVLGAGHPLSQLSSIEAGLVAVPAFGLVFLGGVALLRVPELADLTRMLAGALARGRW
jgi:putative peptidoglycan lipid II flippase